MYKIEFRSVIMFKSFILLLIFFRIGEIKIFSSQCRTIKLHVIQKRADRKKNIDDMCSKSFTGNGTCSSPGTKIVEPYMSIAAQDIVSDKCRHSGYIRKEGDRIKTCKYFAYFGNNCKLSY